MFLTLIALRDSIRVDIYDIFLIWQIITYFIFVLTINNSLLKRKAEVKLKNKISSLSILVYSYNTTIRRVLLISLNYNILSIRVEVRRLYIEVNKRISIEKSSNEIEYT